MLEGGSWHANKRNWSVMEKECFGVVHFMDHWQHLLLGAKFEVVTNHQALSWMFRQAEPPTGKLAWWMLKTQPFQHFGVKYRPSQVNNHSNMEPLARQLSWSRGQAMWRS